MTLAAIQQRVGSDEGSRASPQALEAAPPIRDGGYLADRGSRSTGFVLTIAVHAIVIGIFLVRWSVTYTAPVESTLSVFEVAPPAAPPQPKTQTPPEPEHVEIIKPQQALEVPKVETPDIQIPSEKPVASAAPKSAPEPHAQSVQMPAQEAKPAVPAPQVSKSAQETWEGKVLAQLNRHRRYPRPAMARRQQGVPWIRFVMDREGRVLSVRLERSSGFPDLDREAVALPKRAQPLPKPPEDRPSEVLELVVPVEFFLR